MIRRAFWIAATPIRISIDWGLPRLNLFPKLIDDEDDT